LWRAAQRLRFDHLFNGSNQNSPQARSGPFLCLARNGDEREQRAVSRIIYSGKVLGTPYRGSVASNQPQATDARWRSRGEIGQSSSADCSRETASAWTCNCAASDTSNMKQGVTPRSLNLDEQPPKLVLGEQRRDQPRS
jgi:hypothetical protein